MQAQLEEESHLGKGPEGKDPKLVSDIAGYFESFGLKISREKLGKHFGMLHNIRWESRSGDLMLNLIETEGQISTLMLSQIVTRESGERRSTFPNYTITRIQASEAKPNPDRTLDLVLRVENICMTLHIDPITGLNCLVIPED